MIDINLWPCPYCGSEVRLLHFYKGEGRAINAEDELDDKDLFAYVSCCGCGTMLCSRNATPRQVIEMWNRQDNAEFV